MFEKKYVVKGYDNIFLENLEAFYRALHSVGGYYVYRCRRGKCTSEIRLPRRDTGLVLETPGLYVSSCRLLCREDGALLPPPPTEETPIQHSSAEKGFVVGYAGDTPVYINEEYLWRHIAIIGSTGSGKTHTAARIARCASALGITVVVLDWHGEYPSILSNYTEAKILAGSKLPRVGLSYEAIPLDLSLSAIESVLGLSQFQATILGLVLGYLVEDTENRGDILGALEEILTGTAHSNYRQTRLKTVLDKLERKNTVEALLRTIAYLYSERSLSPNFTRSESEVWLALIRRIGIIASSSYSDLFIVKRKTLLDEVEENKVNIFILSTIHSPRIKKLYTLLLLQLLYTLAYTSAIGPLLVVVEEAQHIADTDTIQQILAEARKYKLGLVLISHTTQILPPLAQSNINTVILHRVSETDQTIHNIPRETLEIAKKLPPGKTLLLTPINQPILTEVRIEEPCRD